MHVTNVLKHFLDMPKYCHLTQFAMVTVQVGGETDTSLTSMHGRRKATLI